jgi:hypothetical protein
MALSNFHFTIQEIGEVGEIETKVGLHAQPALTRKVRCITLFIDYVIVGDSQVLEDVADG